MANPYDPFQVDGDPFQLSVYNAPAVPVEVTTQPTQTTVASAPPGAAQDGTLTFDEYSAFRTGVDPLTVYDDYVKRVLPSYLVADGLNAQQQALEIAEFKRLRPAPQIAIPERTFTEALVTDPLVSLAKGGNALMQGGNFLLDFITPESWDKTRGAWLTQNAKDLDALKSANMQARDKRQQRANEDGVWAAVTNAATDPAILASMIIESLPSMAVPIGASAQAGKIALKAALAKGSTQAEASTIATAVAQKWAMISEGAVAGASVGAKVEEELDKAGITDTATRLKWTAVALPAGVITAALGKFSPVEASLFTSKLLVQGTPVKLLPAILKGASKEAVEEYLQSGNEAVWTNVGSKQLAAWDKRAWDGVAVDAALGALVGGVTGGALGGAGRSRATTPATEATATTPATEATATTPATEATDFNAAVNAALGDIGLDSSTTVAAPVAQATQEQANENQSNPQDESVRVQQEGQSDGQEAQTQRRQQEGRDAGQNEAQASGQTQGGQSNVDEVRQVIPVLPAALAGAKPRFAVGKSQYQVEFDNDVDKALYIVGKTKTLSSADNDYLMWLEENVYPEDTPNQIRGRGKVVGANLKAQAQAAPKTKTIRAQRYFTPRVAPTPVAPTPVAPTPVAPTPVAVADPIATQALNDLQIADDPTLDAETAVELISRIQDAIETSPSAAQAAAFVAAESTAPAKRKLGQPRAARSVALPDPGVDTTQPSLPRKSRKLRGSDSTSARADTNAVTREAVLAPAEAANTPVKDSELERLSGELSTLPVAEAKELSNYLYQQLDVGFGKAMVNSAKLAQARELVFQHKQAYKLKKKGVDPVEDIDVLAVYTDPDTGDLYDSRKVRTTFKQEPLNAATIEALRNGNLNAALKELYYRGSTPLLRATAGRLSEVYLGAVKVQVAAIGKAPNGDQIVGQWDNASRSLKLDPTQGMNEATLIHEAVHAATLEAVRNPKTPKQKEAVRELDDIFRAARSELAPDEYAFTDVAEFVAEALSNPNFQFDLLQIKASKPTSLWQRFTNAVLRLTGLDNLLGRTMNVVEALLASPTGESSAQGTLFATAPPVPTANAGPVTISVARTNREYTWFFDREAPVLNAGKQIEQAAKEAGVPIPEPLSVRLQNILKRSRAEADIRKWEAAYWKPITDAVQTTNKLYAKTIVDAETFLEKLQVLGRAEQKLKEYDPSLKDYKALVANAQKELSEATTYLSDLETNNPTYFAAMLDVANKVKRATDATLDARLAARNNMTPARLAGLKTAFGNKYMPGGFYIPLQLDEGDGTQVSTLKQSLGRNFKADRPLARIYAQAALTAHGNELNREKQMILKLAKDYNIIDEFTKKPLIEIGPVGKLKRDPTTGQITEGIDTLALADDAVGVWLDDQYVKMRIADPALRKALQPYVTEDGSQVIGAALGAARYFTQLMSVVRTSLNPGFAIFNFLRDQGSAAIQLDSRISYGSFYAALLPAMSSAFYNTFVGITGGTQSAKYLEALDNGAFISQRSYVGLFDTIKDVQQDISPTLAGRMKAGLSDPLQTKLGQVLTGFAQALETATRLAVYDAAIASGLSPQEAAAQAKTTTTNFERKSNFTNGAGPFFMFVNAKMQGTRTLLDKTVGYDANPRTQGAMGALLVLGLLAAAAGYENSEVDADGINKYFKIADFKRDSRIIFKEGTPGIPLPQEASLFYVLGNTLGDVIWGPATTGQGISRFLKNMLQQAAPLGAGQTDPTAKNTNAADYIMRLFLPTLGQPVYDLATNKDTFGRSITPESLRFKGKADSEKYTRSENSTSIAVAKYLYEGDYADISPATISYLAKYLEGGSVSFWRDMFGDKPASYPGQETNPLARRFSSEAVPYGDVQAYKDALSEMSRVAEKAQKGSISERGQLYKENQAEIALFARFKAFETYKARTLFKGYDKMSDAQVQAASQQARDRTAALMREYYKLKGIVKE
jgi:hypothetical protein